GRPYPRHPQRRQLPAGDDGRRVGSDSPHWPQLPREIAERQVCRRRVERSADRRFNVSDGRTSQARVAVVTGGGGGIGGETSLELARRGHTVVVMDPGDGVQGEPLGEPTAAEVAGRINAAGGRSIASTVSVTDRDGLRALFRSVVDDFGSLDVVVN